MKHFTTFLMMFVLTVLFAFAPAKNNDIGDDVLAYTNAFRESKGLADLHSNTILDAIAQKHSEDMATGRVKFGHDGFAKRNSQAQKQIAGLRYFAENVAFGANTGQDVVTLWKNSDGHRKNMLGKFSQIGIGVAKDKQGKLFFTQVFSN